MSPMKDTLQYHLPVLFKNEKARKDKGRDKRDMTAKSSTPIQDLGAAEACYKKHYNFKNLNMNSILDIRVYRCYSSRV